MGSRHSNVPFLFLMELHHYRLLAAVREGEHKSSVIVDGDALNGGAESAVLPFGVEEVKFAKLLEKHRAELAE